MSQYKVYPAYKDSGVEWIGQVPEHWEVKRLKRLISQCQNGVWGDDPLEDGSDTLCIRVADFDRDNNVVIDNPPTYRQIAKDHQDSRLVSKGDILLEKSGGGAQTLVGANVRYLGEEPAVCSNFVAVVKPSKNAESAWLNYLMASMYALKINLRSIKQSTGIQNLDSGQYLDEGVAAPSFDEQATIAATLDRETARIDALIQKKTRFIELLKEKRQALITHAVTKGLDPNVKMKDSGVEWIGKVPEHWDVKPFFALVTELNRKNVGLVETNILSLSYGNIIQKPETRNMGLTPESYETYQIVESGEIVFRFTDLQNDKRSLRSAQVTQRGIITSAYMAVKPRSIDSTYFAWLMRSYDLCKVFYAMGGGLRQSLKFEDVRRLPVLIPPVDEQSEITNIINAGTARIDALVEKTEQSITLLKERRAAFITAAVTGQIDLRGEQ
ncbi:TPA: restriction endonuclease subunit S [Pseudomonas aeruginosa]|nr:restriction endonuclease subunit S [Pseudomonas aeruginosa]|tara:strand:- start:2875 stop:4197 length:1323 start_codon:yes stop_codon:yes gene_type:complete